MTSTVPLLVIAAIIAIWGLTSIVTGQTAVGGRRFSGDRPRSTVVYRGRGLGFVMLFEALVVLVIYALTATTPARLNYDQSLRYVEISLGVFLVIAVTMCIFSAVINTSQVSYDADKVPKLKPVSLHDAAHYLHMPEEEVLQMAENGGLESRQVNGNYMFDKDILETFRDMMGTMK